MAGRYIELNISALQDTENHQEGYVLVFRDNTIRKQTEIQMYANERRYRTLFEKSNDAIFIIDLDTNVIIANNEAATLLDTELAKLLQQGLVHYLAEPDYQQFRQHIDSLVAGEAVPLYETHFLRFSGVRVPSEVSLTLVRTADGDPLQVQMIVRDISERRQAEQDRERQFQQLQVMREVDEQVNSSLDIHNVIEVSLQKAVDISKADAGYIALTEGDAVVIRQVAGLYQSRFIGQILQYDVGIAGHVLVTHEATLVLDAIADNRYIAEIPQTRAVMTLPLVSQERLVGVVNLETSTADNFTEELFGFIQLLANRISVAVENARLYEYVRKQLVETELLNDDLRKAEALKTDMIRIANHDIKNPLSIAQGYVSLLQADQDNFAPEYADFFNEMAKALERMAKILDDFLSVEAANQRAARSNDGTA